MASCPQPNQNTKEKGQSLESAKLEELVTACLCFSQTAPILWGGGQQLVPNLVNKKGR